MSDVRSAGPDEWADLAIRSARGDLIGGFNREVTSPPTHIGRGVLRSGGMWTVDVSAERLDVSADESFASFAAPADVQPVIRRFTSTTATIVVASAGAGLADGGKLRVRLVPVDVDGQPGEPIEPGETTMLITEAGLHMAAYGYSEPASGVAEIIDAQGTVIATLNL